ncbi:MAG: hypothetical protein IJC75_02015 [Oscillospiraceae bacterium]|nr:hypothetical protein [Oscillospiraceae bacterium]
MDDLSEKLQSLLTDPESMKNIAQLAAMMNEDHGAAAEPLANEETDSCTEPDDGFDFSKLLLVGEIMEQMQQQDDDTRLLLALKPYLSEERSKRVDRAVKLLRLYTIVMSLKEKGLLADLADSL